MSIVLCFCVCRHLCIHLCVMLKPQSNFFISDAQTDTHTALFVSAQPRQAGSSYLPCGVKGSVSNIHGCEAIKSWCDYRGMINARTETSKNINFYSQNKREKNCTILQGNSKTMFFCVKLHFFLYNVK